MAKLTWREAALADAEIIDRMNRDLSATLGEGAEFEAGPEDVRRDAFGPNRRYECRLAELDGVPAGLMNIFMTYSTYKGAPCLYIDTLFVEPWARGQGIGAKLMAVAAQVALERDCCRIDLLALKTNPARAFYESIDLYATDSQPYTIGRDGLQQLAARA